MPSIATRFGDWFERTTGWENTLAAWKERLTVGLWLFIGVLILIFGSSLSVPLVLLLGSIWILGLGVLGRRGWLHFFGPVFFFDFIRLGRKRWVFSFRMFFALFLGFVLCFLYIVRDWSRYETSSGNVSIPRLAEFSLHFFVSFATILFLLIGFMTPAYLATCITDEKERKTLEFLLATDLRNREIVFGKFAARIGTLSLFILAGVPILTLTQFFGGVDPDQVLAAFGTALIFMLGLAAISIWCSVSVKRSRDAILLAYLIPLAYFVLTLFTYQWAREIARSSTSSISLLGYEVKNAELLKAFSRGNLIAALDDLDFTPVGMTYDDRMWQIFREFALFYGIVIGGLLFLSVWRMRAIALRQTYGGVSRISKIKERYRPEIGDAPIVWKEVFVDTGLRFGGMGKLMIWLVVVGSFVPLIFFAYDAFFESQGYPGYYSRYRTGWEQFAWDINRWLRIVGSIVTLFLLLAIAVRGAGCVRGEKDRLTFDSLMTTPLSTTRILWGKWWGCMLSVRMGLLWLLSIWSIGLVSGGLQFLALPGLILALVAYMSAFAWIGIWFSVYSSSTLRATVYTVITGLISAGGFLLILGFCCLAPILELLDARGRDLDVLVHFFLGLAPVVVMVFLPFFEFSRDEFNMFDDHSFTIYAILGWFFWIGISFVVSNRAFAYFKKDANRVPYVPEPGSKRKEIRRSEQRRR